MTGYIPTANYWFQRWSTYACGFLGILTIILAGESGDPLFILAGVGIGITLLGLVFHTLRKTENWKLWGSLPSSDRLLAGTTVVIGVGFVVLVVICIWLFWSLILNRSDRK